MFVPKEVPAEVNIGEQTKQSTSKKLAQHEMVRTDPKLRTIPQFTKPNTFHTKRVTARLTSVESLLTEVASVAHEGSEHILYLTSSRSEQHISKLFTCWICHSNNCSNPTRYSTVFSESCSFEVNILHLGLTFKVERSSTNKFC